MFKQFVKQTPLGLSLTVLVCAGFFAALLIPIFGRQTLIVRSGSMEPAIDTGDLVLVVPNTSYSSGDIITFKSPNNPKILITHRITSINLRDGVTSYKTKGDANNKIDEFTVTQQNIVGKAEYRIKQIGKLLAFAKTKSGFLTFAAIPAGFVILLEISNIYKEVRKSKKRSAIVIYRQTLKTLYQNYGKPMGVPHPSASFQSLVNVLSKWSKSASWSIGRHININSRGISLKILLPLIVVLLLIGNTYSSFQDSGHSTANVFSAASVFPTPLISPTPTPTPTPTPNTGGLVINEFVANPGVLFSTEWVEIYNSGATTINLTNWKLTDAAAHVHSLTSLGNIPAGGFGVLDIAEGFLNNTGGDTLFLKDPSDTTIDSYTYSTSIADDKSIGRNVDGTGSFINTCTTPTKGSTNNGIC